jgi:two-component system sensor histidine kinase BaeS
VTSQDELGQLTATFNQMSADLARADQQRKRLTADITHDLSTPLQIIAGYMEMFEDGVVSITPQRIEVIKTEVEHLRRLVSDLTTLTQVEAGGLDIQMEPVQPAELLEHIYQTYQPIAARQGVALEIDAPVNLPEIRVDEGRMQQVLKNLVENALRYTPGGGTIQLSAVHNGSVELRVTDSGSGIDAEDLPYVFDRFYQADKARGANTGKMGLGLAICKALITAQGGRIAAESAGRGMGASMVITFEPASAQ